MRCRPIAFAHRRLLPQLSFVLFLVTTSVASADASCGIDAGADTDCTAESNPTSAGAPARPSLAAGGSVNLASGGVFREETDYHAPDSPLQYRRRYASVGATANTGLGPDWQGSYDTRLLREGKRTLTVLESGGRRVRFDLVGEGDTKQTRWQALTPNDGWITRENEGGSGERHVRFFPDGRRVHYYGVYPVLVDYPGKEFLELYYRHHRLAWVKDRHGAMLHFHYTPGGSDTLPTYLDVGVVAQPGQLERLTLPSGEEIRYGYDIDRNLVRVDFPDGTRRRYAHDDALWPSHLTGIAERDGALTESWHYEEDGLVSGWSRPSTGERLVFDRTEPDAEGEPGITRVTDDEGTVASYRWRHDDKGHFLLLGASGKSCRSCPASGMDYAYRDDLQLELERHASGLERRYGYDEEARLSDVVEIVEGREPLTRLRIGYRAEERRAREFEVRASSTDFGRRYTFFYADDPPDIRTMLLDPRYVPLERTRTKSTLELGSEPSPPIAPQGHPSEHCLSVCAVSGGVVGGAIGYVLDSIGGGAVGTVALPGGGTVGGAVIGAEGGGAGGAVIGTGAGTVLGHILCSEPDENERSDTTSDERVDDVSSPTTNGEPPECKEIVKSLKEALYRDKRVHRVGGRHGYINRMIEQMCGRNGPGTLSWRNHAKEIQNGKKKIQELLEDADFEGCSLSPAFSRSESVTVNDVARGNRWDPSRIIWRGPDHPVCELARAAAENRNFDGLLELLTTP